MPGKTTTTMSSAETVSVKKTTLEGVPEWEPCQDSPTEWGRERGDSMRSAGSSKSGENGSVFSGASTSEVAGKDATASGSVEAANEAKEKDHVMKRTSSWMKNLGNGMRTLRLRKGSGSKKKKEKLDDSILDEDASSTAVKGDGEPEPVVTPEVSTPPSPSIASDASASVKQSKFKKLKGKTKVDKDKDKGKEKEKDKKKSVDVVPEAPDSVVSPLPVTCIVVQGPELVPVPSPEPKPVVPAPVVQGSKIRKRGLGGILGGSSNNTSGSNGTAGGVKPTSENPDKTDPARFIGEGLCFKAKLIGVLEVSGPRGDRICQEALSELKMAVKAAGEHKQKVTTHVALDGLRLRDEKTGDCLYHHQVHKISFIAQDLTDTRAFGYIFGSPDTGHRFFGIKTEKSASQVVMAMRDLFQVVFDLKKKEIERAKQQLELQQKFLATRAAETAPRSGHRSDMAEGACALSSPSAPAEADLLNLEVELNSLQEGLENIHSNLADSNTHNSLFNRGSTASISSDPMNPISPGYKYPTMSNNVNNASPGCANSHVPSVQPSRGVLNSFGDSFDPFDSNPSSVKLWPSPFTNDPFSQVDPFAQVDPFPTPKLSNFESGGEFFTSDPFDTSGGAPSTFGDTGNSGVSSSTLVSRQNSIATSERSSTSVSTVPRNESNRVLQNTSASTNGPTVSTATTGWQASFEDNFVPQSAGSDVTNGPTQVSGRTSASLDIFTELDPLGTGRMRPFVDRKDFFHELKNPPKKVLKDLSSIPPTSAPTLDHQNSIVSLSSVTANSTALQQQHKVLHLSQNQEPTIPSSFSTHFNPPSTSSAIGGGGLDFESHFKLSGKNELRTSTIRVRLPSSSGGDSPPAYSPPPPPPPMNSACNSVYFINPPVSHIAPPLGGSSRVKKSPGLLKHMTISNTPASANPSNTSPKTLPRSVRLGKQFSIPDYTEEIPSLTPPPPPRPPPSSSSTLTRNSATAVPRPHSGNENRRQNYASLSSITQVPPEPPPRPLQTTTISDISSSSFAPPLVSPPPPLPPKKQTVGPTLSSSILGKLLYTSENSSAENENRNDLPLPLPSRRNGNTNSISNSTSNMPRYALPAENPISSPILYNRKKVQMMPVSEPDPIVGPETPPRLQMTMEQALNHVASLSLGQLAGKLGLPVSQLSYLTIHQLAEQLTVLDLRRNSDVGPTVTGFTDTFESNFDPEDNEIDQNDFSTASAPPVCEGARAKSSNNFDKYAVFRELTLEDASGFSIEGDVGGSRTLTSMTSRDSSSERTLQADDGPEEEDVDGDHPMLATMDDITDVNFSDGGEDDNEKSVLDDEVVDLNSKSEWATFESNFDEQFVPLSKSEESPWESDADGDGDGVVLEPPGNIVIKTPLKHEHCPRDQFDFVPFEKPPPVEHKRRDSQPLKSLEEPKFQRQSSSSSKHSDRSTGITSIQRPYPSHGKPRTASDCSADSGKDRPFSGSSGRRYSRGGGESDEESWSIAPPPSHSAAARKIRSHRHHHNEEDPSPSSKPPRRRETEEEGIEDDDDRSHASYHSTTNSYSRERKHRRYHPSSSKYYDTRHGGSQSLQRHGRYKGRRPGSPDRYSNHESDFEDSFEDEGVGSVAGRKREYLRDDYWSAGSRPSSSGSGRRYPPPIGHRGDRERGPDYHNSSYHSRENRYGHSNHNRHYRGDRGRYGHERKDDDESHENVSDFSEEEHSGRWGGPGKRIRAKRTPQPYNHRDRDSKPRYYYTNSPSYDSESPPPGPEVPPTKKGNGRYGSNSGSGRPSSATHSHHNNSFVNTPPAEERDRDRVSSASASRRRDSAGRESSRYQSELALNTSRKLSASEFRFEDGDFNLSDRQRPSGDPLSSVEAEAGSSSVPRISETNSNSNSNSNSSIQTNKLPGQRPPESPFEDNFVVGDTTGENVNVPENETSSNSKDNVEENERDVFFPTKFDFNSQAVEQLKGDDTEDPDNSLDVSEKSVESLQETPPSTEMKSVESLEIEMKKSNSFNIFARETDPFEDDDFFK